jgi:hypothetical protein
MSAVEEISAPAVAVPPEAEPAPMAPPAPDVLQHAIFLAMALAVIVASFTLGVGNSQKVELPGMGWSLPSVCQFKNLTGVDCPGCGLSRGFIHLAHGDFVGAWQFNPAAALVFLFVAVQVPYRSLQLWRIYRGAPELNWRRVGNVAIGVIAVALVSQWLVKVAWWIIG